MTSPGIMNSTYEGIKPLIMKLAECELPGNIIVFRYEGAKVTIEFEQYEINN